MSRSRSPAGRLATGLAFLAPNIVGVLLFTAFPVVFSLIMAFTNWDLTQQNMFRPEEPIAFKGLDNWVELLTEDRVGEVVDGEPIGVFAALVQSRFARYFGNTLFFMMAIPFAVAASLAAAILLSQDVRGGGGRNHALLIGGGVLLTAAALLVAVGLGATAMTLLILGAGGGVLLGGLTGGLTFYRALFYTPHFVAGVATFVLWKRLFSTQGGPINQALQPVLDTVATGINAAPVWLVRGLPWLGVASLLALLYALVARLRRMSDDADLGRVALALSLMFAVLPLGVAWVWDAAAPLRLPLVLGGLGLTATALLRGPGRGALQRPRDSTGLGTGLVLSLFGMTALLVLLGLSAVALNLPAMAADGLEPPNWLRSVGWAKPALMLMGFWAAIGSNNMLLYLAALTNVPRPLYEAAEIDGAGALQRFWHVTWPQLAPTTFFIFVMSTIGGLQGGFEAARVMTGGGPAGATTTLSYFIYEEGFLTGRLGFASAVAWLLFVIVLVVTLLNWKFGNAYVED